MPCRPGHIDDLGNQMYSMSRRQLLSKSAMMATALGAGGALLSQCGSDDDHEHEDGDDSMAPMWGMITLYKADILTLEEARSLPPEEGKSYIQLPFYNNHRTPLAVGQVVGCQVMTIGCPARAALAVNLLEKEHDHGQDKNALIERNERTDKVLRELGYEKPWSKQEPCVDGNAGDPNQKKD